jgi:threonyl-tRNA synthetase
MSINSHSTNLTLDTKRHSFAHLMAAAVGQMFPEAQYGVGPVIENGCYYDFVLPRNLIPEDLPLLENHIKDLLKRDLRFKVQELSLEDAITHFDNAKQPLKVELLENLRDRGTTSMSEEEKADFENANIDTKLANLLLESKLTGKELFVDCIVFNEQGEVFAQKRSANRKKFPGNWELVGGGVEEGETFEQAARRELKEELNFDLLEIIDCLEPFDYVLPESMRNESENINHRIIPLVVKVADTSNPILEAGKADTFTWINEGNIELLNNNGDLFIQNKVLEALKSNKNSSLPPITIYRIVDEKTGEVVFEDLCKGPHVAGVRRINNQNNDKDELRNSPLEGWQPQVDGVDARNDNNLPEWKVRSLFPFWNLPKNKELESNAKELRQAGVLSETIFWQATNNKDILKYDIDRQAIIGNYIVDFFIPELGLVFEVDGESHDFRGEQDMIRENYLKSLNLEVVHFADIDIKKAMDQVNDSVMGSIKKREIFMMQNPAWNPPRQPAVATPSDYASLEQVQLYQSSQEGNHSTAESQNLTFSLDNTNLDLLPKVDSEIKPEEQLNLQNMGFKLDKFSASYWRGDQARGINMQRLYALVFETKDELKEFVNNREEAKKRDHRTLGSSLKLFTISDLVGSGFPLFQPKGAIIRKLLEDYLWQLQKHSHQRVYTPHLTKQDLYDVSGHSGKYLDDMFSVYGGTSKETFYVKPMNCPMHMQIFDDNQFSYKDMPVRYFDPTTVYRDEKTGQLSGLTRVRSITQDDGHIFCRVPQIQDEFTAIVQTIREFYGSLGMTPDWVSWSVRDSATPDKYLGDPANWDIAEEAIRKAAEVNNLTYKRCEGEAAFYGPKLDFMFKDCIGREWQLSTIQCDFVQPERFNLSFVNENSEKERPVVIHRAISGSLERFMGILIEHFAGKFPFWLAPEQIRILTINDQVLPFVNKIKAELDKVVLMQPLKYNELRYSVDDRMESLGKKIRDSKLEKIPMFIVVGPKDMEDEIVSIEYNGESVKVPLSEVKAFLEAVK